MALLEASGAIVVDEVELAIGDEAGDGEWEVLQYEFKADLNRYLAAGAVDPAVDTLAELIEFNRAQATSSMPWFGQEIFELSDAKGPLSEPTYVEALEASHVAVSAAIDCNDGRRRPGRHRRADQRAGLGDRLGQR